MVLAVLQDRLLHFSSLERGGFFVHASGKCISYFFQKCFVGYLWLCSALEALEPNTGETRQLSDHSKVEIVDAQSFMRPPVISSKLRRQLNLRS